MYIIMFTWTERSCAMAMFPSICFETCSWKVRLGLSRSQISDAAYEADMIADPIKEKYCQ